MMSPGLYDLPDSLLICKILCILHESWNWQDHIFLPLSDQPSNDPWSLLVLGNVSDSSKQCLRLFPQGQWRFWSPLWTHWGLGDTYTTKQFSSTSWVSYNSSQFQHYLPGENLRFHRFRVQSYRTAIPHPPPSDTNSKSLTGKWIRSSHNPFLGYN